MAMTTWAAEAFAGAEPRSSRLNRRLIKLEAMLGYIQKQIQSDTEATRVALAALSFKFSQMLTHAQRVFRASSRCCRVAARDVGITAVGGFLWQPHSLGDGVFMLFQPAAARRGIIAPGSRPGNRWAKGASLSREESPGFAEQDAG